MGHRLTLPSTKPVMSRAEYLERWSSLHGDAAPTGLVGWWLGLSHTVASPLVRARVSPDAVTLLGLLVALSVVVPARTGGRWPLLAVLLVAASGLLDNLDGAVAVMSDRVSRWGFVLDSVCDRVADGAYVVALWSLGVPGPLAVAAAALAWLHEYLRARATVAGMADVGVVSVAERPTRVIVTAMFLLGAGIYPSAALSWALAGVSAWVVLGLVGFVQLVIVVRRRLR